MIRMWRWAIVFAAFFVSSLAFARTAAEQARARDEKATAELQALAPELVEPWRRANAAWETSDIAAMRVNIEVVRKGAPTFLPARRFEVALEARAGNGATARTLAKALLNDDPSAMSHRAMAIAQLAEGTSDAEHASALVHADEAARSMPTDFSVQALRCQAAALTQNTAVLHGCSDALVAIDPTSPVGYHFRFYSQGMRGDLDGARASLEESHARGLPDEAYRSALEQLDQARPWPVRIGVKAAWVFGAWAGVLLLLVVAGAILSRITLAHATRAASEAEPRSSERLLRRVYRVVLALTCTVYYASVPLLALSVLGLGVGMIVAFFAIGHIPIKLVAIIGFFTLVTAWVVIKSVFVRGRDEDPGDRVALSENPRLAEVLAEVAARIGTRPVDAVYLTPGTDVAVFERGGMRARVRGKAERCLVLGAGVLDGMDLQAFKSVLAHEYGHFKNEDTAGGSLGMAVRRSIFAMAIGLAQGGVATWYNPAWHFVSQFHKVFVRISHGATRLQEILADRWAAFAYGSDAFVRGLTHVVRRSVAFDVHVNRTISEVVEQKVALANLYRYQPAPLSEVDAKVDDAVSESLARTASEYDSHPPPNDRIAWVRALAVAHVSPDADVAAWTLFADRNAIEASMTARVREVIAENHGVAIPAEEREPAAAAEA